MAGACQRLDLCDVCAYVSRITSGWAYIKILAKMVLLLNNYKKKCAVPIALKKNGSLFIRQSERLYALEEKLEILQENFFTHSGNPPQGGWVLGLRKISLLLIELQSSAFQSSWLQWLCLTQGRPKYLSSASFSSTGALCSRHLDWEKGFWLLYCPVTNMCYKIR